MLRQWRAAVAALLLCCLTARAVPSYGQSNLIVVYVNGVKVGVYPIVRAGIVYLPAHTMAAALRVNVNWNPQLNLVKLNGIAVMAAPLNEEGRLYLPVEAMAVAVGGTVEWDGINRVIRVFSPTAGRTAPRVGQTAKPPVVVVPPPPQFPSPPPVVAAQAYNSYQAAVAPPPPVTTRRYTSSAPPRSALGTVYVPQTARNNVFEVTVTNVETVSVIKDYYRPRSGCRFVLVYLSQQNISDELQTYTGKFALLDESNRTYEYLEGLSNFWLVILRPYGINFGYLVFEVPLEARPSALALYTLNQPPLTLGL